MLRFIFGASGAGKSTTLNQEIIRRAQEEPDRNFWILVPDQFTMQTQLDVVKAHPCKGIMNIDVLSFSRLTRRIFDETGYPKETVLDDLGKSLVLRHVAERIKKDLPVIGAGMKKAGYLDEVKSTVSELMQYDIAPKDLDALIAGARDRKGLRAKLLDLQRLYAAFLEEIEARYFTAEETLVAVAKRIPDSALLKDAVVAFDGFTGFTPVQYRVMRAILQTASETIVTLTIASNENPYMPDDAGNRSLFALSKKTTRDFLRAAHLAEKERDPQYTPDFDVWEAARRRDNKDITLPDTPVARHKDNDALAFLERHLLRDESASYERETDAICLFAASTPAEETRQVFRKIRAMLREDDTLQYRDIAIVCAHPEDYEDAIERVAADFDIPVYQDKTTVATLNPLIEYLRSVAELMRSDFSPSAAFHYLRSGLTPDLGKDVDYLELYTNLYRIRGRGAWSEAFLLPLADRVKRADEEQVEILTRIEATRKRMMDALAPLIKAIEEKGTVRDFTVGLYRVALNDGAREKLRALTEDAEQTWTKVVRLLEQIDALLGTERMTFAEYADLLEAGYGEVAIGTIPGGVDRVQVGDLTRTRMKEMRYLFLMGASDQAIPGKVDGGGFLSELDRDFLGETCKEVELAPTPLQQMYIQRLYLYMTLTKPTGRLFVSYARMSADSQSARPSYLIGKLRRLFPTLTVGQPERDDLTEQAESAADLSGRMAALTRAYAEGAIAAENEPAFFASFFALPQRMQDAFSDAAFFQYRATPLSETIPAMIYAAAPTGSVTRLEQFASCAYRHFLRYGLRLKDKATYEFSAADLGNIYHGVLELFSRALAKDGVSWTEFTKAQAQAYVRRALSDYAAQYAGMKLYDTARGKETLRRVERVLLRATSSLQYHLQKGSFVPATSEQAFDMDVVSDGLSTRLYGRIDRVDLASDGDTTYVKVVDFKSGARDVDISSTYYGLQLQLILYMDAALAMQKQKTGEKTVPAALLYYRVTDPMINADDLKVAPDEDAIEQAIREKLRATGLVNGDEAALRLLDRDMETRSDVIPVAKTAKGAFTAATQAFDLEDYETISRHVRGDIARMSKRVMDGDIAARPFLLGNETGCDWCGYKSVCGFDPRLNGFSYRELEKMTMEEALEAMREKGEKA